MWKGAFRAAFYRFRIADVLEIPAALILQQIKRTIAKQAIEIFRINTFMARIVFAIRVHKELETVFHFYFPTHFTQQRQYTEAAV